MIDVEIKVLPWTTGRGYTAFFGKVRVGTARHIKDNWWICWVKYKSGKPVLVEFEANASATLESICTTYYLHAQKLISGGTGNGS